MCVELNIAGVYIPPTAELHWHLRSCLWHAQAAGSTPPRAPRLLSVPSAVSSGLEAGRSLLGVSQPQFFLCAKPGFLSAFRVLYSVAHSEIILWRAEEEEEAQFLL